MNILPPGGWPPPPTPINWKAMSAEEMRERIDSLDQRMADLDDNARKDTEELRKVASRLDLNRKIGLGGVAVFALGMALNIAFKSPVLLGIGVAGNAVSIGSMIYQYRGDSKKDSLSREISELEHQKNLSGIMKTVATEKLSERTKAQEAKDAESQKEFHELAQGVAPQQESAGILDEEQWVGIDGVKIRKNREP
ncbi:MAG: hypothetical protein RDV48_01215 [Candidatus Eremiobacteraeota bacterium]|nr:hypothetical protein [Candidatus Eremiobacteraeota bacterium]